MKIVAITLAIVFAFALAGAIRLGASSPCSDHDDFARDCNELSNEIRGLKRGIVDLGKIGWPILIPIGSLVWLGWLVWSHLT